GQRIACGWFHEAEDQRYGQIALIDLSGHLTLIGPRVSRLGRVAWLPDGSGLIFSAMLRDGSSRWQIAFLSYPDGQLTRVTNDGDSYGSFSLGLSADAHTIATIRTESRYELWSAQRNDYSKASELLKGYIDPSAGVDARGEKVAFGADHGDGTTLWVADVKTGNRMKIRAGYWPMLSPDGSLIAFTAVDQGKENVWLSGTDGTGLHQLTFGNSDATPVFSVDGKFVFYNHKGNGGFHAMKIAISGGTPTLMSDKEYLPWSVSPDGRSILMFERDAQTNREQMVAVSLDTMQIEQTLALDPTAHPHWLSDGESIAYLATVNGVGNIWKIGSGGGPPTQLTHFETGGISDFAITGDGTLVMSRGQRSSEVVLTKNVHVH